MNNMRIDGRRAMSVPGLRRPSSGRRTPYPCAGESTTKYAKNHRGIITDRPGYSCELPVTVLPR